jgi:hydroxypyruvate isomerase
LRLAAQWAAGIADLLIEPINTRDIPGYFLNFTRDARDIIAEAQEPNLGLQLDLYHRQVMEGDVAGAIAEFAPLVRHYQCAAPPDRGEPDRGEIDYQEIFKLIDATGYSGWIGCEYKPRAGTREGLVWMKGVV